jgi:hypothetical protein
MSNRELIYRDEAIEAVQKRLEFWGGYESDAKELTELLESLPAVVPKIESGSSLGKNRTFLLSKHPE